MPLSDPGYAVILSFEGIALRAYQDIAGVWTIAGGVTNADKAAVQRLGRKIGPGLVIDMATALELTRATIDRYIPAVDAALPGQPERVRDGGTSFHYNTGAIARASWVPKFKAGDLKAAKASILSWNKAGGQVRSGLARRRAREWAIITVGDYGPEAKTPPLVLDEHGRPTGQRVSVAVGGKTRTTAEVEVSTVTPIKTGDDMLDIQTDLKALGYDPGPLDGVYGEKTRAAVRKFQEAHPNLTADGIPGRATHAAIDRAVLAKRKAGRVTKAATAATTAATVATWFGLSKIVPVLIIGAALVVLGIIAYRYRNELKARINKALGKAVV